MNKQSDDSSGGGFKLNNQGTGSGQEAQAYLTKPVNLERPGRALATSLIGVGVGFSVRKNLEHIRQLSAPAGGGRKQEQGPSTPNSNPQ